MDFVNDAVLGGFVLRPPPRLWPFVGSTCLGFGLGLARWILLTTRFFADFSGGAAPRLSPFVAVCWLDLAWLWPWLGAVDVVNDAILYFMLGMHIVAVVELLQNVFSAKNV